MTGLQVEGDTSPSHEQMNPSTNSPGASIDDPAVHITPLSEFVTLLPESYSVQMQAAEPQLRASISPVEPDTMLVCMEGNMLTAHRLIFPENRGRVLKLQTINQFNGLAFQLVSRNLLMIVRVMYRVRQHNSWALRVEYLAVLVNTKHPSIQPQLEAGLKKAFRSASRGRRYALEINFNNLVCDWLKSVLHEEHALWKSSRNCEFFVNCEGARLVITNHSEYSGLFDVRAPDCCCLWMFCCPCCCLACPAYAVTRHLLVDDYRVRVKGEAKYWDLRNLSSAEEGLTHLRDTLTDGETKWNQVFDLLQARCNAERTDVRTEMSRDEPLSYSEAVTSQPQSTDAVGLPSYEEAILLSGGTTDAAITAQPPGYS